MTNTNDSVGSSIATGTQDLAALAGVFGTDSVERNALATQQGTISVAVSSLSMLGLLGLVKSTLKITLGLDRCRSAGFNLDTIRGLFGYARGEPASRGNIFDCTQIKVTFSDNRILIHRKEKRLDDENTPMVAVGSGWKDGFKCQTVINLGNVWHEKAILEQPWFSVLICFLCSGATSWLLLLIRAPWTWTRIYATAGLHVCLMLMVSLPLWYICHLESQDPFSSLPFTVSKTYLFVIQLLLLSRDVLTRTSRRTGRPQRHLTPENWDLLHDGSQQNGSLSLLLVAINGGNVVHFQQDVSHIHSPLVRFAGLVVSAATVVAYICQYAIVKTGSNKEVIIWISSQAAAALIRVLYWTFGTSFDLPWTSKAEYAIINNSTSEAITLVEILAACTQDTVELPRWAWTYMSSNPLWQVLKDVTHNTHHDEIPRDAPHHIFHNVSIGRLIENRRRTNNKEDENFQQNTMWTHIWTLALWKDASGEVRPFIVIPMEFKTPESSTDECFVQATKAKVKDDKRLLDPCSMFACDYNNKRLHIQPFGTTGKCTHDCPWGDHITDSHEHKDSGITMRRDSQIVDWVDWLLSQDPTDKGLGYTMTFDRERNRHIYVTGTKGTTDRTGDFYDYEQAWTSRIHGDLKSGLADLRKYIVGEYNCDKLREKSRLGSTVANVVVAPLVRWATFSETTKKDEKDEKV